jgi:hypothetical protein
MSLDGPGDIIPHQNADRYDRMTTTTNDPKVVTPRLNAGEAILANRLEDQLLYRRKNHGSTAVWNRDSRNARNKPQPGFANSKLGSLSDLPLRRSLNHFVFAVGPSSDQQGGKQDVLKQFSWSHGLFIPAYVNSIGNPMRRR